MAEISDEILIAQLRDEKTREAAFAQMVQKYQRQLYWQIRKMVISHEDTDDVLQNTFIKAWTGMANFRGDSKLSTWLYRIAMNETITFLNNQRARNTFTLLDTEDILLGKLTADSYFDGDEAERRLQEAILTLPDKQRAVFNMRYFEEKTYEEMEQIFGTSQGALKASYHIAQKKIEQILSQD